MNHFIAPSSLDQRRTRLQPGGRVVIPADYRDALKLAVGEEMIMRLKDGEIHIYSVKQAIARAQKLFKKYRGKNKNVVDELIAERRLEAKRELDEIRSR